MDNKTMPATSPMPVILSFLVMVSVFVAVYDGRIHHTMTVFTGMMCVTGVLALVLFSFISYKMTYYEFDDNTLSVWTLYPVYSLQKVIRLERQYESASLSRDERMSIKNEIDELNEHIVKSAEKRVRTVDLNNIEYVYVNKGVKGGFRRWFNYGNVNLCENMYKAPKIVLKNMHNPEHIASMIKERCPNA